MKVYTRTGDDGTTGLFGAGRVSKAHARIEAYGTVDEANAALGMARAAIAISSGRASVLSCPTDHEAWQAAGLRCLR